ncbi:MAG: FtsQ-type POTRA domain-containing protein [Hyphomicrobiales bacterium]|nr:FtsQ-type POTRA domain-containing protein [Hyphomicrobiales bacterium]MCY4032415.1 FtsQ-type POTRA domain-containing protein [Hyphomicrobiales bacterium]MCY4038415.1 FtsQ-type POTRA domain-containing protein [Hyphomicrobiales bacterium]
MLALKFKILLLVSLTVAVATAGWGSVILLREEVIVRVSESLGFQLEEVVMHGNVRVKQETLLEALALERGKSLFLIDLAEAKARLESLEWVKSASLQRIFPGTIKGRIHEQQPFAFWQEGGHLFLINKDGDAFLDLGSANSPDAKRMASVKATLPYLVGTGALEDGVEFLESLQNYPAIGEHIKAVVRVGQRRWDVHLNNGARVQMPEKSFHQALVRLQKLHLEYDIFRRDVLIIDLRLDDRVGFALREGAAMPEVSEAILIPDAVGIIPLRPKARGDG